MLLHLPHPDWLVESPVKRAQVAIHGDRIVLSNGLLAREFARGATISLRREDTGEEFLRAVRPEASFDLNGVSTPVGGLAGQPDLAYLDPQWLPTMRPDPKAFRYDSYEVGKTVAPLRWRPMRGIEAAWPPKGVSLTLRYVHPSLPLRAEVRYELYDGIPLYGKRVSLLNETEKSVRIDSFLADELAAVEGESVVDEQPRWRLPAMSVVTDYSFGGMSWANSNKTAGWETDSAYSTQVNYKLTTPCLLRVRPPVGPGRTVKPGERFDGFRSFVLLHDSDDRERQGLAVRRMGRLLAPWTQESPLMLHLTTIDREKAFTAIDQAAECGFEMVILSFGSGLNMEDVSDENVARMKALADHAHAKGLRLGGYSLLASRSINPETDIVGPAVFGNSPCLASAWGIEYFRKLKEFLTRTEFDLLEHDGSYPGDICSSTSHAGHQGREDSQWNQHAQIAEFYNWCRERDIYLNVPDNYFLNGSNKTGIGYRETNWSLPRAQQHIHARQHFYDGTFDKTPSMGWGFIPLVEYQGGGQAATIEPLREHLDDYRGLLLDHLGFGIQACVRGPRLYDSPETKAMVQQTVAWFKQYRSLLEGDVIHLRRADGRRLDSILHVSGHKGMLLVYNPTNEPRTETQDVPLYHTGLKGKCRVTGRGAFGSKEVRSKASESVKLDDRQRAKIEVTVPSRGMAWVALG
ncbi:alpha-galactosidase [bacterium]|nr:MAG: alpha-galactosidase [bacterium]